MKKCSKKKNCKGKVTKQDGDKNLMCTRCFNKWLKDKTKHKLNSYAILED